MSGDDTFMREASLIASRNLTHNVGAVSVSFQDGHLSLTYYLRGAATEDDEEEREISAAELVAAFPQIRTCETFFAKVEDQIDPPRNEQVIWPPRP